MEINKAIVSFESDLLAGIPQEVFTLQLPSDGYDAEELEELADEIKNLYGEWSETTINVFFENTKTKECYNSSGVIIESVFN